MWIFLILFQETCHCVAKNRNNLDIVLWSSEVSYFRDILFHKYQVIYTVNHHMNKGSKLEIYIYYSEQWIFFYISFRGYIYMYMDFQYDENVTLRYYSITRRRWDVEVRSGEIFVFCNEISGHHSEFLYTGTETVKLVYWDNMVWWDNDEMFYRDLVRYFCFVMRYQVICRETGTSIYWYLPFGILMRHISCTIYQFIIDILIYLYLIQSYFICCFEFISQLYWCRHFVSK